MRDADFVPITYTEGMSEWDPLMVLKVKLIKTTDYYLKTDL